MKLFLIIVQVLYSIMLVPWFLIWGLSFMVFDSGISFWGIGIMIAVTLYPVTVAGCSILSWVYLKKIKPVYTILINCVPSIWIISIAIVVFVL